MLTSPQANAVSSNKQGVAEARKSFGMDVIPICGDQLAEIEGAEEELGFILEHQIDSESDQFDYGDGLLNPLIILSL